MNAVYKTIAYPNRTQGGYALLAVVVVMAVFTVVSLQYMERTAKSIQLSSYGRNSSESLLMAEGAMNTLYGQFIFGKDIDRDNTQDNTEEIITSTAPPDIPLSYMFYVTGGNGIDQTTPSLLQRVANGEATATSGTVNAHSVAASTLQINDLFHSTSAPILFIQDSDNPGHLAVGNKDWAHTDDTYKAAAWIELVRNPTQQEKIEVYVQAMAQVGNAKSYVQRFAGTYSGTLGRRFGAVNESKPPVDNGHHN